MPTATHETICQALQTAWVGLGGGVPRSVIRAEAWLVKGEAMPLMILSMGDESDGQATIGGSEFREYQTLCTVIYPGRVQLETGLGTAKGWRESYRKRLTVDHTVTLPVLPGASMVWDVAVFEVPPMDPTDFLDTYTTARLGVICRTNETSRA